MQGQSYLPTHIHIFCAEFSYTANLPEYLRFDENYFHIFFGLEKPETTPWITSQLSKSSGLVLLTTNKIPVIFRSHPEFKTLVPVEKSWGARSDEFPYGWIKYLRQQNVYRNKDTECYVPDYIFPKPSIYSGVRRLGTYLEMLTIPLICKGHEEITFSSGIRLSDSRFRQLEQMGLKAVKAYSALDWKAAFGRGVAKEVARYKQTRAYA